MSRIGKKPVIVPSGVKLEIKGQSVKATGPLGTLEIKCHSKIKVKMDGELNQVVLENQNPQDADAKQLHGTTRALIANMLTGVSKGFEQKMEIFGTGYNVKEQGGKLIFQVGYCHPVQLDIPKSVKVNIEAGATRGNDVPAKFTLTGIDKAVLGEFAAKIRKAKPPEPYQGKGIRYADEHIKRKVGKAFASGPA